MKTEDITFDMAFECLLICRDPDVVRILDRLLGNLSISAHICLNVPKALGQLSQGSIDLIVVDGEDDTAELVGELHNSDSWHKPTVLALTAGDYPVTGAHVVLHRPVTEESCAVSLRSAYSRMLGDYRRRARYPVMSSVQASNGDNRSMDITITDIGDGGFGFISKEGVSPGDVLRLRLLLPGAERPISVEARVRWTRNCGAAGCEYLHICPTALWVLDDWLKSRTQIKKLSVVM
jgi:hypothetical protein